MPQQNILQSLLNSGEFSPRMESRLDFVRYPNACRMARNIIIHPQGGMARRPGTRHVAEVKNSDNATRIIPFEYDETDAYVIEAGDAYFRFYRRQGRIVTVNTDAAVTNGQFTSNINGWSDLSTGTASIAHDATDLRLKLTGATGGKAWAQQPITINSSYQANEHVLRFRIEGVAGGTVGFQVGSASGGEQILTKVELLPGYHSIGFTPNTTTFYIQFVADNTPARNMYVDDVEFLVNVPMELTSPYASADLDSLQHYQAADVVYLLHQSYAPRKLERRGHRRWSIVEVFWEDGPYLEINEGTDLELKQLVKNGTFENGMENWNELSVADQNRMVVYNESGKFVELATPGGTAYTAILRSDANTVVNAKKHVAHVLILAAGPVGLFFGSFAGASDYINSAQQPGWHSYEFTTVSTTLYAEFQYAASNQKGRAGVGSCIIYSEDAHLLEPGATDGITTLTALGFSPFTADDVDRLIRLEWPGREPGYCVVTDFTSSTQVTVLVMRKLAATTPTETWQFGAWGGDQGYPKTMSFFDGRLAIANTVEKPNSMWFSQSGQLENMRPDSFEDGATTVQDDDALSITMESTKINPIYWLSGLKRLLAGTAGGEWVIQSSGAVITPIDVSFKQHSSVPCADVRAVEVNQNILFIERAQRQVHELGFSFQEDSYLTADLTILADHIFRSPCSQLAYQHNPYGLIWGRREDGRLATLVYNKLHQVLGWSQSIIGGAFGTGDAVVESMAIIPGAEDAGQYYNSDDRGELWLVVKRTINGVTKRYIEFMERFFDGPLREDYDTELEWQDAVRVAQQDAFYVDSGLSYDGAAISTVTGLDHLEGETVKVLADGIVIVDKTVASGSITLTNAASKIHVGLGYKHRYEGLKLAAASPEGTTLNKIKIITNVGMMLLDASEFDLSIVEYDEDGRRQKDLIPQRFLRDFMDPDEAVPLFSGEKTASTPGSYTRDSRIYVESDNPLPWSLLGLAPQLEVRPT